MIPTDLFYENMMAKLEKLTNGQEQDTLQQKMAHFGFETTWLLPNLGSLVLFIALYPLMIILFAFLHMISLYCMRSCKAIRNSMGGQVFWNWPISFLRDSYVVLQICCLFNYKYRSWEGKEASLNSALSISMLSLLIIYPLLI